MVGSQRISWMRGPVITMGAGGGTMGGSVTAVRSRVNTVGAPQGPPEAIRGACEEAGSTAWRDRVLTPVPTLQRLRWQMLPGPPACSQLPPLSG